MTQSEQQTRMVGLLGWPVSHSLSPLMQNAALQAAGIDARYVALPVRPEGIEEIVHQIRCGNYVGSNVTIPHKVAVAGLMDRLTREANICGAVNTIRVEKDRTLTGHNTDCLGAIRAVESDGATVKGKNCLIIGAGGAGRGVAVGCALAGAKRITILNRTLHNANAIVHALESSAELPRGIVWEAVELFEQGRSSNVDWNGVDVAFQVTRVGMDSSQGLPLDPALLPPHCHVLESIYAPLETEFLFRCRAKGLRTSDGLSMLLEQGAASFEFWFDVKPDRSVMRKALDSAL